MIFYSRLAHRLGGLLLCSLPAAGHATDAHPPASHDMIACARLLDEQAQHPAESFDPAAPSVVLVDGYSSGRLMPAAFRAAGLQVIHVHATGSPPQNFVGSFWPRTYHKLLDHDGSVDQLVRELAPLNVAAVLPGTDTGVLFSDVLATALRRERATLPSNGVDRARKDKALMQERLREHGLDSILQTVTSRAEDSVRWIRAHGLLDGPGAEVVVKPLMSAGGEGVHFLRTEADVHRVFDKLVGQNDGLGNENHRLLTQEYIAGTEYVVNSTIWNGRVIYTDIWEYHKRRTRTGRLIYDYDVLMPYEGEVQSRLRAFDRAVLNALGITHGNSHSEIKMVEGRGPVLIETNNRPMGASQPALAKFATGRSQIDLTATAVADPADFGREPTAYTIRKNAIVFTLVNLQNRTVRLRTDARETLRRVPGYFRDLLHDEPGSLMPFTEDMFKQVGEVWLLHEDMDVLMRSVDELHRMERDGRLFEEP